MEAGNRRFIELGVGDLCADNPLEWDEVDRARAQQPDVDFKWFYWLLDPEEYHGRVARIRQAPAISGPRRPK